MRTNDVQPPFAGNHSEVVWQRPNSMLDRLVAFRSPQLDAIGMCDLVALDGLNDHRNKRADLVRWESLVESRPVEGRLARTVEKAHGEKLEVHRAYFGWLNSVERIDAVEEDFVHAAFLECPPSERMSYARGIAVRILEASDPKACASAIRQMGRISKILSKMQPYRDGPPRYNPEEFHVSDYKVAALAMAEALGGESTYGPRIDAAEERLGYRP